MRKAFLSSKAARILSIALLAQAAVFYGFSRTELTPENRPLTELPREIGAWRLIEETAIDKDTLDVLRADETLSRIYASPESRVPANLFVAFFRSQRTGQTPHSPKNCLPGAGWVPSVSDRATIPIEGRQPIEVNRYIIARGEQKSVVLYWYQSRDRVVASEYEAKFYVVADSIRYNRSDTALVKIVVPVVGNDEAAAMSVATRFVQSVFNPLRQHLPV